MNLNYLDCLDSQVVEVVEVVEEVEVGHYLHGILVVVEVEDLLLSLFLPCSVH
jgi:hypothetical protein